MVTLYTRPGLIDDPLLTAGEVAEMYRVDRRTVDRWARDGMVASLLTPGGHHRFRRSVIVALLEAEQ